GLLGGLGGVVTAAHPSHERDDCYQPSEWTIHAENTLSPRAGASRSSDSLRQDLLRGLEAREEVGRVGVCRQRLPVEGRDRLEDLLLREAPLHPLEGRLPLPLAERGVGCVPRDRLRE